MRLLAVVFVAVAALSGPVVAAGASVKPAPFDQPEAIQRWITTYRTTPAPKRLPAAVKAMSRLGVAREIDTAGLYIGFVAGVLGANPLLAEKLVADMFPLPAEDQVIVVRAIAWSGLPEWKEVMGRFVERMPARRVLIDRHLFGKPEMVPAHWSRQPE